MNLQKRGLVFLCALFLMIGMAGCKSTSKKTADPQIVVKTALERIEKAENLTAISETEMEMSQNDTVSTGTSKTEIWLSYKPLSVKMVTTNNMDSGPETNVDKYLTEQDGKIESYTKYGNQWMKHSLDKNIARASFQLFDVKNNLILFLNEGTDWTVENETDGTAQLKGMIPKDKAYTILEETKVFQSIGMAGLEESYFEGVGDLPVRITIDTKTGYPVGYELDFAEALQVVIANVMKGFGQEGSMSVSKFITVATARDINKTQPIEIPKEGIEQAVDYTKSTVDVEDLDIE